MSNLSREVLKWILTLDLSYPIKNVKRDISSGFLVAEILSRYYPSEVAMHSFDNSVSLERKRSNWKLLAKLFNKKGIPIDSTMIEQVVTVEGDAAAEALQTLYNFIHGPTFEATHASEPGQTYQQQARLGEAPSTSYPQQMPGYGPMFIPSPEMDPATSGQWIQQQQYLSMLAQMEQLGVAAQMGYQPPQQQYQTMETQQRYQQQPQVATSQKQLGIQKNVQKSQAVPTTAPLQPSSPSPLSQQDQYALQYHQMLMMQQYQMYQQESGAGGYNGVSDGREEATTSTSDAANEPDALRGGLAFSKKPRPVEFQPYGQKEFADKNYNVKSGQRYWQLGTLGPDMESAELQAKREKAEMIKQMAAQVKEENARKLAAAAAKPALAKPPKEPTGREKALMFAKNIPPPPPPPPKPIAQPPVSSKPGSKGTTPSRGSRSSTPPISVRSELEILEEQHDAQAEAVERLRLELLGAMRK